MTPSADAGPARTGRPLVELRGIDRRYPNGTTALDGVDLRIDAGESVAIIGRSGSGKSTLLNVLGLLDAPSAGQVVIDGEPVLGTSDAARSRRRAADLGFIFQRSHLIPALSVVENVLLGLRYSPDVGDAPRQVALDALRAVGLDHRTDVPARTLSGGEMQRVAIARTLARPVRLWLADEPTGNLDSAQSEQIIELLKERAAQRGAALVVVTHEPDIAARLDRVVTLHDGRVVDDTGPLHSPPPAHTTVVRRTAATTRRQRLARTLRFIAQGVATQPARTRAGVTAAAIAVTLTVAALGLAQSASAQVTSMFDARRATQVSAQLATDEPSRWPLDLDQLTAFPGVVGAELWWHRTGIEIDNAHLAQAAIDLVQVAAAPRQTTSTSITWAPGQDESLDPGEVLLGQVLAERLGIAQIDLSPEVTIDGEPHLVAGIVTASQAGTATGSAFVTDTTGMAASTSADLYVQTVPGAARTVADRLQTLVDPYQGMRMTIDPVLEADAYRGQLQDSIAAALLVLAVVASLAGLVAVVFVNVLAVSARAAEFGVRRAFGASRGELVTLVMGEGATLGLIGAGVGLATGFTAVMAVTAAAHWQPVFDLRLLLVPLTGALLFGTFGALPPAISAGRIQPADAVRA